MAKVVKVKYSLYTHITSHLTAQLRLPLLYNVLLPRTFGVSLLATCLIESVDLYFDRLMRCGDTLYFIIGVEKLSLCRIDFVVRGKCLLHHLLAVWFNLRVWQLPSSLIFHE